MNIERINLNNADDQKKEEIYSFLRKRLSEIVEECDLEELNVMLMGYLPFHKATALNSPISELPNILEQIKAFPEPEDRYKYIPYMQYIYHYYLIMSAEAQFLQLWMPLQSAIRIPKWKSLFQEMEFALKKISQLSDAFIKIHCFQFFGTMGEMPVCCHDPENIRPGMLSVLNRVHEVLNTIKDNKEEILTDMQAYYKELRQCHCKNC